MAANTEVSLQSKIRQSLLYRLRFTIDEIAMKLLRTTHIIDIQCPAECEDETLRESDAYKALLQRLNLESNLNLAVGAIVANEMRDAVLEQTQFTCSAGIAYNKVLAKLVAGMNKPKQQTLIFQEDVPQLYKTVKIKKVRHLGGKLGLALQETLHIEGMDQLAAVDISQLKRCFGDKTGDWLYWLGQGIDNEPIRIRQLPKSVGCCKNFRGPDKLDKVSKVSFWLSQLASEVCERLDEEVEVNNRVATHLGVTLTTANQTSFSRSCKFSKIDPEQVTSDALRVLREFNTSDIPDKWEPAIICLGLAASKFEEHNNTGSKSIKDFLVANGPNAESLHSKSSSPSLKGRKDLQDLNTIVEIDSKSATKSNKKPDARKLTGLQKFFHVATKDSSSTHTCTHTTDSLKPNTDNDVEVVDVTEQEMKDGENKKKDFRSFFKSVDKRTSSSDLALQSTEGSVTNQNCASLVRDNVICGTHTEVTSVDTKKDCDPSESSFRTLLAVGETPSEPELKQASNEAENVSNTSSVCKHKSTIQNLFVAGGSELSNKGFTAEDFVLCNKCGKRILIWELPEHNDFHFAKDLSHDLNRSASSSNSPVAKAKSPPRKKTKLASSSIENFFKSK